MAINFGSANDIKDLSKFFLVLASSKPGEKNVCLEHTLTLFELGQYFSKSFQFNFIKSLKVTSSEKMGKVCSLSWINNPNQGSDHQLFSLITHPRHDGLERSYALLFKADSQKFEEVFNTRSIFKFRMACCDSLNSSVVGVLRNTEKKTDSLFKMEYNWVNAKKQENKTVAI